MALEPTGSAKIAYDEPPSASAEAPEQASFAVPRASRKALSRPGGSFSARERSYGGSDLAVAQRPRGKPLETDGRFTLSPSDFLCDASDYAAKAPIDDRFAASGDERHDAGSLTTAQVTKEEKPAAGGDLPEMLAFVRSAAGRIRGQQTDIDAKDEQIARLRQTLDDERRAFEEHARQTVERLNSIEQEYDTMADLLAASQNNCARLRLALKQAMLDAQTAERTIVSTTRYIEQLERKLRSK